MRSLLIGISVIGLVGAGAAVTWSVMARPQDAYITHEVANSFNLQDGSIPARAPSSMTSGETLRDAVAAAPPAPSSLTRPIATEGMSYGAMKAAPVAAEKKYTVITAKAETWARKHSFLAGLVARPTAFLMSHSSLGSSRSLHAFLADPKKVDGYMNSALVRITLNSPTVAKALLGNPAVIRAFLATPAMSDSKSVRELLASPMVRKMIDCPAIQEALGDPAVMNAMMADPQTVMWVAAHPQALTAITEAVPALGEAFTAKTGR